MAHFIENDFETIKPSYQTFCAEINLRSTYELTSKHKGRRVAYQNEIFYCELDLTTPRHGDRPFGV